MSLHPDPVEFVAFRPLPEGLHGLGAQLGLFSCPLCPEAILEQWLVWARGVPLPSRVCWLGQPDSAESLPDGPHHPGLKGKAMEAGLPQPPFPGRPSKSLWLMLQPDLTLVPPQAAVTKAQPPNPSRRSPGQYLAPEAAGPEAAEATSGHHSPYCE